MEKPVVANIPKTKAHFATMGHKINTEKLREMLREVCMKKFFEAQLTNLAAQNNKLNKLKIE